jgi:hypothetical protein
LGSGFGFDALFSFREVAVPLVFDRSKPEDAAKILQKSCPRVAERRLILGQLVRSIAVAESIDSDCWAVTLFIQVPQPSIAIRQRLLFPMTFRPPLRSHCSRSTIPAGRETVE